MRQILYVLLVLLPVLTLTSEVLAQKSNSQTIEAVIDLDKKGPPIDSLLYGHFIENLHNWFEGGLWAEMLGDRKFFYPVNNADTLKPINTRSWILGRWLPLGPEKFVIMDTDEPFVGEHSPKIILGQETHGIYQDGLILEKGREYEGRIILKSDVVAGSSSPIKVSLVWGDSKTDLQTVVIDEPGAEFKRYSLNFTAADSASNGRIEISGIGAGSFTIGTISLMPADNIDGFRPDLVRLLREMRVTMLRWGGNFSAGYMWMDGVGDQDLRPPRYDYAWNAVEQNDVGTFEFLRLCELTHSAPNIGVNAGLGDAYSAANWVEYVNGPKETSMGRLRADHGHPDPFNVKWWGIGNEMYGKWQLGHIAINHYVIKHNMFASKMKAIDPDIILVASGASINEMSMTARHWPKPLPAKLPFEYGSLQDWSGWLLENSSSNFDYLAEHFYPTADQAFDLKQQKLVDVDAPLIDRVRKGANRVQTAVEAWETYNKKYPWLKDSGIKMVLDEWVTGSRGHTGALAVAVAMNEIYRHTDIFKMSAYTCGPCALTYNQTSSGYRGIGLVFKLLANEFAEIPVEVRGTLPQPEIPGTIGVDKPKISSGSNTYPMDVMAAVDRSGKTLTVSVVNPTTEIQELKLELLGKKLPKSAEHFIIAAPSQDAINSVDQEAKLPITLKSQMTSTSKKGIIIKPLSVNLYKYKLN